MHAHLWPQNPKFRVEINDTEPIFFYCGAEGSCMEKHMIGAINPVSGQPRPSLAPSVSGL